MDVAAQVFERYAEAAHSAETGVAEKLLRAGNLKGVTSAIDPLGLVVMSGGVPQINHDHKALVSIRDHLESQGMVDGKRLSDHFTAPPFGWSSDTLRYLVAAMLVDGQIKLKLSGREIAVPGQQAIDALKTNNSFKPVGVALRDAPVDPQLLARAAARITELKGEQIVPLGNEISRAVAALFPQLQTRYGTLPEKLSNLGLPGQERLIWLSEPVSYTHLTLPTSDLV